MSDNKIQLNKELADRISTLIGNVRKSVIELAALAAEVRNQYLDASGRKYDPEFEAFWKAHDMDGKFGTRATFTKYANVGDVIHKVQAQYEAYADRLPVTLSALYEISQLNNDEIALCLTDTYKRTELTLDQTKWSKPKKPKPLIQPHVQAGIIAAWRKSWRNPTPPNTDKRRVRLAEIKIHDSFGTFNGVTHTGAIGINELDALTDALKQAVAGISADHIRIDLHDEKLKQKYRKSEEQAEAKEKAAAEAAKKKPKKKKTNKKKKSAERLKSA